MKNKTSIIIGGTKGIGSVITKKLKDRGDKTIIFQEILIKKLRIKN